MTTTKREDIWADSHRDLHGFECIFFPIGTSIVFEIHQVFSQTLPVPMSKNLRFKTAKHSKGRSTIVMNRF